MKRTTLALFVLVGLSGAAFGADVPLKEVNGTTFHAPMLEKAVAPKSLMNISFGTGEGEVGGSPQDAKQITEGVPTAFRPQQDGNIWLLDAVARKLKCFSPVGKLVKTVALPAAAPGEDVHPLRDFALGPEFGFYLLDPADKMIKRLDSNGKVLVSIEGLADVRAIYADATGNVFAENPVTDSILCFKPDGEIAWQLSGIDGLSPYTDGKGNPYGIAGDDTNATLFQVVDPAAGKTVELGKFPLEAPAGQNITYASRRIIGIDDNRNIYFELLATNPDGVVFQHRFYRVSPDGKTVAFREVQVKPFFAPDIARDFTVLPEGRILGFSADETSYQLLTYDLNS